MICYRYIMKTKARIQEQLKSFKKQLNLSDEDEAIEIQQQINALEWVLDI